MMVFLIVEPNIVLFLKLLCVITYIEVIVPRHGIIIGLIPQGSGFFIGRKDKFPFLKNKLSTLYRPRSSDTRASCHLLWVQPEAEILQEATCYDKDRSETVDAT